MLTKDLNYREFYLRGKVDDIDIQRIKYLDCSYLPMQRKAFRKFFDGLDEVDKAYTSDGLVFAFVMNGELHMNSKLSNTGKEFIANRFLASTQTRH